MNQALTLLICFIIGVFATWRITWDLTSCTRETPDGPCEPNLEGPFKLYTGFRWLFKQSFVPEWAQEGAECPYCLSWWAAGLISLLLPIYTGLSWVHAFGLWFAFLWGISGAVALYFRRLHMMYRISASEM